MKENSIVNSRDRRNADAPQAAKSLNGLFSVNLAPDLGIKKKEKKPSNRETYKN